MHPKLSSIHPSITQLPYEQALTIVETIRQRRKQKPTKPTRIARPVKPRIKKEKEIELTVDNLSKLEALYESLYGKQS